MFYLSNIYFQVFLDKYNKFLHFRVIPSALMLIATVFLKLIVFIACSMKNSQNVFMQPLTLNTTCLFSTLVNERIVDIEKPAWWNMLAYFRFRQIFRNIFTSINIFYHTLKICINNKWYFIRFLILIKF